MKPIYHVICLFLIGLILGPMFADADEPKRSYTYLVERRNVICDKLNNKKEQHTDLAWVYYGAGAEQAGGQVRNVPQVVYIDENGKQLPGPKYYGSPIVTQRGAEKLQLLRELPEGRGSNRNSPVSVSILAQNFGLLPFKPKENLKQGLSWSPQIHMSFIGPYVWFPTTVRHEVTDYKQEKGRTCAVIVYSATGEFKSADHPERYTKEERAEFRGEYQFNCNGTALYDPAEGIIVEKEQTVSWTQFGEKLERLKDGKVGWVPTVDEEKTVMIKVSLQPEEGEAVGLPAGTGHPLLSYVLITAVIGIAIVGLILLLKKRTSSSSK